MVCPLVWLRCRRRRWDVACKLAQGPGTANLTEARASLADEYGQPVHVGLPCAKARHSTECRLADPRARRRIASGFAANVLLDLLYHRRFGQRGLALDVFQSGPLLASANANQMAYSGSFRLIPFHSGSGYRPLPDFCRAEQWHRLLSTFSAIWRPRSEERRVGKDC